MGERFVEPAEVLKRHAAIAVGLRELRRKPDRRVERLERRACPPGAQMRIADDVLPRRMSECAPVLFDFANRGVGVGDKLAKVQVDHNVERVLLVDGCLNH